ncbi:MAG TPA: GNAT family N-acetyltransferase [Puia sp.]
MIEVKEIRAIAITQLANEALLDGFTFVQRTIEEWESGLNTFSKPGEKLWALVMEEEVIGIAGLNRDPYTSDENSGRVRHLYIARAYRRNGYARLLMGKIIQEARGRFASLRLFTENPAAACLYEAMGFGKAEGFKVTHTLEL